GGGLQMLPLRPPRPGGSPALPLPRGAAGASATPPQIRQSLHRCYSCDFFNRSLSFFIRVLDFFWSALTSLPVHRPSPPCGHLLTVPSTDSAPRHTRSDVRPSVDRESPSRCIHPAQRVRPTEPWSGTSGRVSDASHTNPDIHAVALVWHLRP